MTGTRLSQDDVFEILKSSRRRYVLYYLRRDGPTVDLSTLATHVAAWEHNISSEELTTQQRKRVYISLYQTHLPTLDEAGLVNFDVDTGTIHLLDRARMLDKYLDESSRSLPWSHYYLSLSFASLTLIGGLWSQTLPITFPSLHLIAMIMVLYMLLALTHYFYFRRYTIQTKILKL